MATTNCHSVGTLHTTNFDINSTQAYQLIRRLQNLMLIIFHIITHNPVRAHENTALFYNIFSANREEPFRVEFFTPSYQFVKMLRKEIITPNKTTNPTHILQRQTTPRSY